MVIPDVRSAGIKSWQFGSLHTRETAASAMIRRCSRIQRLKVCFHHGSLPFVHIDLTTVSADVREQRSI